MEEILVLFCTNTDDHGHFWYFLVKISPFQQFIVLLFIDVQFYCVASICSGKVITKYVDIICLQRFHLLNIKLPFIAELNYTLHA